MNTPPRSKSAFYAPALTEELDKQAFGQFWGDVKGSAKQHLISPVTNRLREFGNDFQNVGGEMIGQPINRGMARVRGGWNRLKEFGNDLNTVSRADPFGIESVRQGALGTGRAARPGGAPNPAAAAQPAPQSASAPAPQPPAWNAAAPQRGPQMGTPQPAQQLAHNVPQYPRAIPVNEQTLQPIPDQWYPGKHASAFHVVGEMDKAAAGKLTGFSRLLGGGLQRGTDFLRRSGDKSQRAAATAFSNSSATGGQASDMLRRVAATGGRRRAVAEWMGRQRKGLVESPDLARRINLGGNIAGGSVVAGGGLYGANRLGSYTGRSDGLEVGREQGWDAGLQHGIANAQAAGPNSFMQRLTGLIGGGQGDPSQIYEQANRHRDAVLEQLTHRGRV